MHALYKEGKSNQYIVECVGVLLCTAQLWTKKICEAGDGSLPTIKKRPGKKMLLSNKTLNVIKKLVAF